MQRAYERELTASLARLCPGTPLDTIQQLAVPSGLYYGLYGPPGQFNETSFFQIDSRVTRASNGILQLTGTGYHDLYFDMLSSVVWVPRASVLPAQTGASISATNGYARLQAALINTQHPSAESGGVQLTPGSPQDAANWAVAYEFDPPFTRFDQLALAVETSQRTLEVAVSMEGLDTGAPVVSCNGGPVSATDGAATPPAQLLDFASSVTIHASFPGVTAFSVAPMPLSEDNRRGWFARDVVDDLTSGNVLAAYQLIGNQFMPSQLLGSPVRTWFISRMPTITMTTRVATAHVVPAQRSAAAPPDLAARLGAWGPAELTQLATWAGLADDRFDFSRYARAKPPVQLRNASGPATDSGSSGSDEVTIVFAPPRVTDEIPLAARTAWVLACTTQS